MGYVGQPGITTAHVPHAVTNLSGCSAPQVPPGRVALWPLHNGLNDPGRMPGGNMRKADMDGRFFFIDRDSDAAAAGELERMIRRDGVRFEPQTARISRQPRLQHSADGELGQFGEFLQSELGVVAVRARNHFFGGAEGFEGDSSAWRNSERKRASVDCRIQNHQRNSSQPVHVI